MHLISSIKVMGHCNGLATKWKLFDKPYRLCKTFVCGVGFRIMGKYEDNFLTIVMLIKKNLLKIFMSCLIFSVILAMFYFTTHNNLILK